MVLCGTWRPCCFPTCGLDGSSTAVFKTPELRRILFFSSPAARLTQHSSAFWVARSLTIACPPFHIRLHRNRVVQRKGIDFSQEGKNLGRRSGGKSFAVHRLEAVDMASNGEPQTHHPLIRILCVCWTGPRNLRSLSCLWCEARA